MTKLMLLIMLLTPSSQAFVKIVCETSKAFSYFAQDGHCKLATDDFVTQVFPDKTGVMCASSKVYCKPVYDDANEEEVREELKEELARMREASE